VNPYSCRTLFLLALPLLTGTAGYCNQVRPDAPPWLPDREIVANGCYISATVYIRELSARFPGARAKTVTVRLPDGSGHTVAQVEWGERTFLRDMYIGVAPVDGDMQASFLRALHEWRIRGGAHPFSNRQPRGRSELRQEVKRARRLLADESSAVLHLQTKQGPRHLLCWKTAEGRLAIYDPARGTAVGFTQRSPDKVALELLASRD
jgi:hypothetical protein